ncbi:hypothetical protein [Clostridium sp. DL-VIII]|nr:hypothetical protein [Clostridium sp. DL-VIII]
MKDEEGVRIFKVLANNITCLLSAKKNNIEMFEALTGSMTNFIRD